MFCSSAKILFSNSTFLQPVYFGLSEFKWSWRSVPQIRGGGGGAGDLSPHFPSPSSVAPTSGKIIIMYHCKIFSVLFGNTAFNIALSSCFWYPSHPYSPLLIPPSTPGWSQLKKLASADNIIYLPARIRPNWPHLRLAMMMDGMLVYSRVNSAFSPIQHLQYNLVLGTHFYTLV